VVRFTAGERVPGTDFIGGLGGGEPIDGLDAVAKRKISVPADNNPGRPARALVTVMT
jgi:hypothetical protein